MKIINPILILLVACIPAFGQLRPTLYSTNTQAVIDAHVLALASSISNTNALTSQQQATLNNALTNGVAFTTNAFYVSASLGRDANNGSQTAPFKTISNAFYVAQATIHPPAIPTVVLTPGDTYYEPTLMVTNINLIGYGATVYAQNPTAAGRTTVQLFEIMSNGTFTVYGGAYYNTNSPSDLAVAASIWYFVSGGITFYAQDEQSYSEYDGVQFLGQAGAPGESPCNITFKNTFHRGSDDIFAWNSRYQITNHVINILNSKWQVTYDGVWSEGGGRCINANCGTFNIENSTLEEDGSTFPTSANVQAIYTGANFGAGAGGTNAIVLNIKNSSIITTVSTGYPTNVYAITNTTVNAWQSPFAASTVLLDPSSKINWNGAFVGDGSGLVNTTPLAGLGPNTPPGSNVVSQMIAAQAPSGNPNAVTNNDTRPTSLVGPFNANGGGNVATNNQVGLDLVSLGAVGDGVTDNTTILNKWLGTPGYVYTLKPGNYVAKELLVTNNVTLIGYGAHLIYANAAAQTNIFIRWSTNTGIKFEGVDIDGQMSSYPQTYLWYNGASFTTSTSDNLGNLSAIYMWGLRHGLQVYTEGKNNCLVNVSIHGFSGGGLVPISNDAYDTKVSPILIEGVECYSNRFGLYASSLLGTYNANNPNWITNYVWPLFYQTSATWCTPEYTTYLNCNFHDNSYDADIGAGNQNFVGCKFDTSSNCAVYACNGLNPLHGNVIGSMINHNQQEAVFIVNCPIGENFTSDYFRSGFLQGITIQYASPVTFDMCSFQPNIEMTNVSSAIVKLIDCTYFGSWATQVVQNVSSQYTFHNLSYTVAGDTDGSFTNFNGTFTGNGGGLTNVQGASLAVTNVGVASVTNYAVNIGGPTIGNPLSSGTNVCFNSFTGSTGWFFQNVDGAVQVLWPTNCQTINTNGLTTSGTNWVCTQTNYGDYNFVCGTNVAISWTNIQVLWQAR